MTSKRESKDLVKCENRTTKGRLTRGGGGGVPSVVCGGFSQAFCPQPALGGQSYVEDSGAEDFTKGASKQIGREAVNRTVSKHKTYHKTMKLKLFICYLHIQGVLDTAEVACLWRSGCVINSLW